MTMIECNIHGLQGAPHVSSQVLQAMKNKNPNGIVYLTLYLEGSEDDGSKNDSEEDKKELKLFICAFSSFYIKQEELGVPPLIEDLSKQEDGYGYIMTFKDEQSFDEAIILMNPVCSRCFAEFVSSNPEIVYPYYPK